MIDFEKFREASSKSLEGLSWYGIISRLGLFSFNTQGNKPIEITAKITQIIDSNKALIVGCGSGGTAVHLAEISGATVYGVDLSPESIKTANELASNSPAYERLHFLIGDAHSLSFQPNTFNVIITEFMAFFLQKNAFEGFFTAIKSSGHLALIELMKDPEVDVKADKKILKAEQLYSDVLVYKFHIPLITDYIENLSQAGFQSVQVAEQFLEPNFQEKINNVGSWKNLFGIIVVMLKLMVSSSIIRKKFIQVGLVKRVLYQNKATAKYISQTLLVCLKP